MSEDSKPVTDWPNEIYSGLGGIGGFKAELYLIIAIIAAIILIVVSIYFIATDDENKYLRIEGNVLTPSCVKASTTYDERGRPTDTYKCHIDVSYQINDKLYTKKIYVVGSSNYIAGEPISLMIDKNNNEDARIAIMSKSTIGSIMFGIALLAVGLAYLNYYITRKFRVFAAAQGTSTIVDLFGKY
jgi:hypothetical protein